MKFSPTIKILELIYLKVFLTGSIENEIFPHHQNFRMNFLKVFLTGSIENEIFPQHQNFVMNLKKVF